LILKNINEKMINESNLESALMSSWIKETSSDPSNWSGQNPSWGQCAVTSLVVNDYLGGEIIWANAYLPSGNAVSHYFNKINGIEKDFTRRQFPAGTVIPLGIPKPKLFSSTRDYVLSYEFTRQRYELLKKRVQEVLKKL
jgi:hypothetical protein